MSADNANTRFNSEEDGGSNADIPDLEACPAFGRPPGAISYRRAHVLTQHMCSGAKRDRAPRHMARKPAWRLNARRVDSSTRRYQNDESSSERKAISSGVLSRPSKALR